MMVPETDNLSETRSLNGYYPTTTDSFKSPFDDHRLVNNAVVNLPATLAQQQGLRQLVDRHMDSGWALWRLEIIAVARST